MFDVKVDGDLAFGTLLEKFHLEPGGAVQRGLMDLAITYMKPYWAWDTGTLATSAYDDSDYSNGMIIYGVDYASKMYYGINEAGVPVHYNTDINPQAGPFPLERMKADHMADIIEGVQRIATGQ